MTKVLIKKHGHDVTTPEQNCDKKKFSRGRWHHIRKQIENIWRDNRNMKPELEQMAPKDFTNRKNSSMIS
jgi:hypothetical protein